MKKVVQVIAFQTICSVMWFYIVANKIWEQLTYPLFIAVLLSLHISCTIFMLAESEDGNINDVDALDEIVIIEFKQRSICG